MKHDQCVPIPQLRVIIAVLVLLFPSLAEAEDDTTFEPKVKPTLQMRRTGGPIRVDGSLDDAGWAGAARAAGFTEVQPGDQVEPMVRTEVLVAYDDTHLYLGFRAFGDPDRVRTSLQNRDEMFQDDWVGIILDTYGDASRAYEIFANPTGVQADLLMTSQGEDPGFDLIFESDGQLTEDGYRVEMAIPFSSLRFPDEPVQDWRATFIRNHPRSSRHIYSWATADLGNPCLPCQLGTLAGITGIEAGQSLDVMPALVGTQSGAREVASDPASRFDNNRVHLSPSVNVRYDVTSSLSAEATVNPDFSQVASDAAQIDVNTTFALSYPERRPFFQEGGELLGTWIDMVYTRSINDPIAAAKATRRGKTSVVYLGAVDERTPLLLPFEEQSEIVEAGRSVANVLRVRRSIGSNSFVGGMVSDRRLASGGAGTEASVDLGYQFLENYRLEGQLVLNRADEPASTSLSEQVETETFAGGTYTGALDGERYWGHGSFLRLERSSRHWAFDLTYQGHSPTFRTASGFVRRNDFRAFSASQQVNLFPMWSWLNSVHPSISAKREINFDGVVKEDALQPEVSAQLAGQTGVYATYRLRRERFRGMAFEGLQSWTIDVSSQFSQPLSGGFYVTGGKAIHRVDTPEVGSQLNAGVSATIRPLDRLVFEPSVDYARLTDLETGVPFYSGYILRARLGFHLNRELSLRVVTQYNDFEERFDVEPMLAYRLNPYSMFYLGSRVDYGAFEAPHGWTATERQFFFKFQYLFRR